MSILERFSDALVMFWQSLDEREQKALLLGVAYALAVIVSSRLDRERRARERAELAEEVVARLQHGAA